MVDQEIIDLPNDDLLPFDGSMYLPLQENVGNTRRRTLNSIISGFQSPVLSNVDVNGKNYSNMGTLNGHDIPAGTDTFALLVEMQTLSNKTLDLPTIDSFINATHNHQNSAGGGTLVATSVLTATGTKDATTFLRGDNTWAIVDTKNPFTWAATDEDSPLPPNGTILYITEPADKDRTITKIIAGLKNAGTGNGVLVEIDKETGPNTNVFGTLGIVEIDLNEFTSTTSSEPFIIFDPDWEEGRRLRITLSVTDVNAAATGLKVTIIA